MYASCFHQHQHHFQQQRLAITGAVLHNWVNQHSLPWYEDLTTVVCKYSDYLTADTMDIINCKFVDIKGFSRITNSNNLANELYINYNVKQMNFDETFKSVQLHDGYLLVNDASYSTKYPVYPSHGQSCVIWGEELSTYEEVHIKATIVSPYAVHEDYFGRINISGALIGTHEIDNITKNDLLKLVKKSEIQGYNEWNEMCLTDKCNYTSVAGCTASINVIHDYNRIKWSWVGGAEDEFHDMGVLNKIQKGDFFCWRLTSQMICLELNTSTFKWMHKWQRDDDLRWFWGLNCSRCDCRVGGVVFFVQIYCKK